MPQIARLTAEDRDDLVAYLDGELEGPAGDRIEKALSSSPVARNEVEMLTRTWDLLDLLPTADPDQTFTQRTLAAAKALETSVPLSERKSVHIAKGAGVLAVWIAGLAAAAAVGYLATAAWVPGESDPIVRDEPLIRDLPRLRDAHSREFLDLLSREGVLSDLPPDLDPDPPAPPTE
ncbi:MAG: hypothetical protein AAF907_05815 [Planctomycetota bacterium]